MITYFNALLEFVHYISELKRKHRAQKYRKNIELEQQIITKTNIDGYLTVECSDFAFENTQKNISVT